MFPVCSYYAITMCRKRSGEGAIWLKGAPYGTYVSTMGPVCAHSVPKPLWGEIDGPTVHHICAHYAPTRCPLYVNCVRTKPVCHKCASDVPTTRPLCAHYVYRVKLIGPHSAPAVPSVCPLCTQYVSQTGRWGAMNLQGVTCVSTMRPVCAQHVPTVSKRLWDEIDGPRVCLVCAH